MQLVQHDKLVAAAWMAPPVVEDKVLPIFMKQMEILHNAERFLPSYNQMQERVAQVRRPVRTVHTLALRCLTPL